MNGLRGDSPTADMLFLVCLFFWFIEETIQKRFSPPCDKHPINKNKIEIQRIKVSTLSSTLSYLTCKFPPEEKDTVSPLMKGRWPPDPHASFISQTPMIFKMWTDVLNGLEKKKKKNTVLLLCKEAPLRGQRGCFIVGLQCLFYYWKWLCYRMFKMWKQSVLEACWIKWLQFTVCGSQVLVFLMYLMPFNVWNG